VKAIVGSTHQEFVGINPTKGDDLRKLFAEKPVAKADPMIFDTSPVLRDMERIAGVQEALSQSISKNKTATEAKIQDEGFNSRTGADRDTLEEMLQDLAEFTTELAIQAVPADYMARLAGPHSFWPEGMAPEDVVTMVELEIRGGSSGKPNAEELRQSWSVILPLVEKIMMSIQEAQLMGNLPLAEAMKNLLQETFRRLDERVSIEKFIPQGLPNLAGVKKPGDEGGEGGPPGPEPAPDTGPTNAADANTLV